MLAAEIASVTAKPSMILARNRRVGNLIENDPVRFSSPTSAPVFILKTATGRPPAPQSLRKTRAEWIRVCKFGPFSLGCEGRKPPLRSSAVPPSQEVDPKYVECGAGETPASSTLSGPALPPALYSAVLVLPG